MISETPPYLLNLTKYPKIDTNPSIFIEEIHNNLHKYPNYKHIYTDSSKNNNKVGRVAIFYDIIIQKHFLNKVSILSTITENEPEIHHFLRLPIFISLKNKNMTNSLLSKLLNRIKTVTKRTSFLLDS